MKIKIRITDLKKLLYKALELIFTGIILAVVASLLTTSIIEKSEKDRITRAQIDSLSNIYIGCNKLWVDENLGNAQFISQKGEYLLCAYTSNYYVVQIAFNEALSAQAYLITVLDNSEEIRISATDSTLLQERNLLLGEFSYYDYIGTPESVFGFVSNGNARALYSESYSFSSFGNYYCYHIASFDFGKLNGTAQDFIYEFDMPQGEVDDEVSVGTKHGMQLITDRQNNYPNTYGVSEFGVDMEELLFTYDWFNSQQLRNKLND